MRKPHRPVSEFRFDKQASWFPLLSCSTPGWLPSFMRESRCDPLTHVLRECNAFPLPCHLAFLVGSESQDSAVAGY